MSISNQMYASILNTLAKMTETEAKLNKKAARMSLQFNSAGLGVKYWANIADDIGDEENKNLAYDGHAIINFRHLGF